MIAIMVIMAVMLMVMEMVIFHASSSVDVDDGDGDNGVSVGVSFYVHYFHSATQTIRSNITHTTRLSFETWDRSLKITVISTSLLLAF